MGDVMGGLKRAALACLIAGAGGMACNAASAQESQTYSLTIQAKGFAPATLQVKAGVKFKLTVTNATPKPAEFESSELNREKIVPAGGSVVVYLGPLEPGSYSFFDDFDQSKKGHIVAK
jgi:plastocyanin